MTKVNTTWLRWIRVGLVVVLLSIIALGHNGYSTGPKMRMMPFQEYIDATSGLLRGWDGVRSWLALTIVDGLGNLVIFMPLGVTLDYALRDSIESNPGRIRVILLLGALLSICFEIIQMWIPGRVTAIDDVIINTTGTVLGAIVVIALRSRRQQGAQNVA